jgi:hypothetical protein
MTNTVEPSQEKVSSASSLVWIPKALEVNSAHLYGIYQGKSSDKLSSCFISTKVKTSSSHTYATKNWPNGPVLNERAQYSNKSARLCLA